MDDDLKARWVAALRSGEYKQGRNRFYDAEQDAYCCMGVLCRLQGWPPPLIDKMVFSRLIDLASWDLLEKLLGGDDIVRQLARLNDGAHEQDRQTFAQIADYIEREL